VQIRRLRKEISTYIKNGALSDSIGTFEKFSFISLREAQFLELFYKRTMVFEKQ
jgi:sRNA-binding regulator protein Hfq